MNVPYVEYIVFGLVLATSIVATYAITKWRSGPKKAIVKVNDAKPVAAALKSTRLPVDQSIAIKPNHWKLEVNGNARFDIKVEWSDGDIMTFSGKAPEVYAVDQEKGVVPVNTSGIPPEWADDGISYQWHLNDHLWC